MDNTATRQYIIESGSPQNAVALKAWFKDAVDHTGAGSRPNELVASLTETQVHGLDRDHGIAVRPVVA